MVLYSTSETATASHLSALLPAPAPARPAVTLCRTPVHAQRYPQRAHTTCSGGATASTARSKHSKLLVPAAMQCLQHLQLTSLPPSPQVMTEPTAPKTLRDLGDELLEKILASHLDRMHIEDPLALFRAPLTELCAILFGALTDVSPQMHMPLSMVNNSSTRPSCRSRRRRTAGGAPACPTWFAACRPSPCGSSSRRRGRCTA